MGTWLIGLATALIAPALVAVGTSEASAQETVKVAVIAPLSGPWARQGQLIQLGAEMAVDEINEKGGIEALGGARLELLSADAGDTPEKAKNAAQRLISQEPNLMGGTGAWLSSFTLAVTEVTERAQVPWLTLSYADSSPSAASTTSFRPRCRRASSRPRRCRPSSSSPSRRPAAFRGPPASSATIPPRPRPS